MKRLLFISALLLSCMLSARNLTILHLNDTHSHIEPERAGSNKGRGGVIEQAAYIDSVRRADGRRNVLLLHAGDFSQGSSYFTILKGNLEDDLVNAMGFDAVCLGNHEFDNGLEELSRRLQNIRVPVVCANYDFSGTALEGYVKPYTVVRKAGKKIGIIGLLTDLGTMVSGGIASAITYLDPAEVADSLACKLKKDGCDLVIALTHLGYEAQVFTDVDLAGQTSCVDVIIGGHSHTFLDELKKVKNKNGRDVVIVTDGVWGFNIGKLTVE